MIPYFLQQTMNGLMVGSVYLLMALGLTLIYSILHIPNFAHGHKYMVGAYITYYLLSLYGFNYWIAILISMAAVAVLGMVVERFLFRPLADAPHLSSFLAALGVIIILENLAVLFWGGDWKRFPFLPYEEIINIMGFSMTLQRLLVIVVSLFIMVFLQLFISYTKLGSSIEAVAEDSEAARLVGININRARLLSFGISSALAAAAASLVAPVYAVSPGMGFLPLLKAFVAIIIGGMGSVKGAVVGSYILGLTENYVGGYISIAYTDLFSFSVLVVILTFRPEGIFRRA